MDGEMPMMIPSALRQLSSSVAKVLIHRMEEAKAMERRRKRAHRRAGGLEPARA
jgi:hypothetical protein